MFHASNRVTRVAKALAVAGGLSLGAAGIAVAATGGSGSAATHQQAVPSPTPVTPLPGESAAAPGQANSDFTPPGEKVETPDPGEAKGNEAESANDPEPNHEDANGANADHTPAGEKPEPQGTGSPG